MAVLGLSLSLLVQSTGAPLASLARVPDVSVSITTLPDNATSTTNSYATTGAYVAYDVTITNNSSSNVAQLAIDDSFVVPGSEQPIYRGFFKLGGSAAAQTTCSDPAQSAAFSCTVGNFASLATLSLRVVYQLPSTPGPLTATFTGTSTGTPGTDPNMSHGDTFASSVTIDLTAPFSDGLTDRATTSYVPTSGEVLETSLAGFGPSNPMWTRISVSQGALTGFPTGTTATLREGDGLVACPVGFSCFGQTAQIDLADHATLAMPFKVELRVDNAKSFVPLKKWVIIHILQDGVTTEDVSTACIMSGGVATNAPCTQSTAVASDDRSDYVATIWLRQNGWIRNG